MSSCPFNSCPWISRITQSLSSVRRVRNKYLSLKAIEMLTHTHTHTAIIWGTCNIFISQMRKLECQRGLTFFPWSHCWEVADLTWMSKYLHWTQLPRVEVWDTARALPESQKTQILVSEKSLSLLLWKRHINRDLCWVIIPFQDSCFLWWVDYAYNWHLLRIRWVRWSTVNISHGPLISFRHNAITF